MKKSQVNQTNMKCYWCGYKEAKREVCFSCELIIRWIKALVDVLNGFDKLNKRSRTKWTQELEEKISS